MEPQRDTPLKRFGAIWIGLFITLSFGVAALVFLPFFSKERGNPALEKEYARRLAIKAEVDRVQNEQLMFKESGENAQVPPKMVYKMTSRALLSESPIKTSQVVPGSKTDIKANSN